MMHILAILIAPNASPALAKIANHASAAPLQIAHTASLFQKDDTDNLASAPKKIGVRSAMVYQVTSNNLSSCSEDILR